MPLMDHGRATVAALTATAALAAGAAAVTGPCAPAAEAAVGLPAGPPPPGGAVTLMEAGDSCGEPPGGAETLRDVVIIIVEEGVPPDFPQEAEAHCGGCRSVLFPRIACGPGEGCKLPAPPPTVANPAGWAAPQPAVAAEGTPAAVATEARD